MEVHGIVADPATLAHLVELDPLQLKRLEPLAHDHVAAEVVARCRRPGGRLGRDVVVHRVARRDDADASRQHAHGCTRFRARGAKLRIETHVCRHDRQRKARTVV